jgi:hypothetical protein
MSTDQLNFFASLDFPGRTTLFLSEAAEKLGVSVRHLQAEAEKGALRLFDARGVGAKQPAWRVPIESYRDYVAVRLTGPQRAELLALLPESTRTALICELLASLPNPARAALLRDLRAA